MRVELKTEGGIAYFPGLSKPLVVDSAELESAAAAELERLVREAGFFDLPAKVGSPTSGGAPARGAADLRTYTLIVRDGRRRHTVRLTDPVGDENLAALITFLQNRRRR